MKDRQWNEHQKNDKWINNDLQNSEDKDKDRATRTPLRTVVERKHHQFNKAVDNYINQAQSIQ